MKMLIKEMSFLVMVGCGVMAFAMGARVPAGVPRLRFETELHDFGRIPQGTPVTARFHFSNSGTAPLVIEAVEPSCGCTTVSWTREAVLPGRSGIIEVEFDAAVANAFEKQIVVRSNSATPVRVLFIRGVVVTGSLDSRPVSSLSLPANPANDIVSSGR